MELETTTTGEVGEPIRTTGEDSQASQEESATVKATVSKD